LVDGRSGEDARSPLPAAAPATRRSVDLFEPREVPAEEQPGEVWGDEDPVSAEDSGDHPTRDRDPLEPDPGEPDERTDSEQQVGEAHGVRAAGAEGPDVALDPQHVVGQETPG